MNTKEEDRVGVKEENNFGGSSSQVPNSLASGHPWQLGNKSPRSSLLPVEGMMLQDESWVVAAKGA